MDLNKIDVIVINSTGASRIPAELCLSTGIIKFTGDPASFSNIAAELSRGSKIVESVAPVTIEEPVSFLAAEPVIAPPRSAKKKRKK